MVYRLMNYQIMNISINCDPFQCLVLTIQSVFIGLSKYFVPSYGLPLQSCGFHHHHEYFVRFLGSTIPFKVILNGYLVSVIGVPLLVLVLLLENLGFLGSNVDPFLRRS